MHHEEGGMPLKVQYQNPSARYTINFGEGDGGRIITRRWAQLWECFQSLSPFPRLGGSLGALQRAAERLPWQAELWNPDIVDGNNSICRALSRVFRALTLLQKPRVVYKRIIPVYNSPLRLGYEIKTLRVPHWISWQRGIFNLCPITPRYRNNPYI